MNLALKNARALVQRTRDAKILRGWVFDISLPKISVIVSTSAVTAPGEEFVVSVFGYPRQASVACKLVAAAPVTVFHDDPSSAAFQFEFEAVKPISIQSPLEEPRFRVSGMEIEHAAGNSREYFSGEIVDIGAQGFSVQSKRDLTRGQLLLVGIHTGSNELTATVEVKNHRRIDGVQDRYRTGFQILSMDRNDSTKWQAMFQSVVDANSLEIEEGPAFGRKIA